MRIIRYAGRDARRRSRVAVECSCGKEFISRLDHIKSGATHSCGCLKSALNLITSTTHGDSQSPEYRSWRSMLQRCENPNCESYHYYGGRGISVCTEWHDYSTFLRDMGRRQSLEYTLDRINANGNYEPSNCRWADKKTQTSNRRPREGATK